VSIDIDTVLRVLDACDRELEKEPLISFVVPKRGGGTGQVFLKWRRGWGLKDYIRDPALTGIISLYQAAHSRIVDHRNIKRRLTYTPNQGDEIRFIRTKPSRV
jgi:hypothetical protein